MQGLDGGMNHMLLCHGAYSFRDECLTEWEIKKSDLERFSHVLICAVGIMALYTGV